MNQPVTHTTDNTPIVPRYIQDSRQYDTILGWVKRAILGLSLGLAISGCVSVPPPENVENICSIFQEKEDWYKDVMDAERKWGTPAHVLMAIVRYESKFVDDARPPMKTFMWLIPIGRPTTAYGYCQAVNGTWENYLAETGNV
ncbi:MAG: hypothetical protein P8Z39_03205, partial [Gammaproteobacteria bacterium]